MPLPASPAALLYTAPRPPDSASLSAPRPDLLALVDALSTACHASDVPAAVCTLREMHARGMLFARDGSEGVARCDSTGFSPLLRAACAPFSDAGKVMLQMLLLFVDNGEGGERALVQSQGVEMVQKWAWDVVWEVRTSRGQCVPVAKHLLQLSDDAAITTWLSKHLPPRPGPAAVQPSPAAWSAGSRLPHRYAPQPVPDPLLHFPCTTSAPTAAPLVKITPPTPPARAPAPGIRAIIKESTARSSPFLLSPPAGRVGVGAADRSVEDPNSRLTFSSAEEAGATVDPRTNMHPPRTMNTTAHYSAPLSPTLPHRLRPPASPAAPPLLFQNSVSIALAPLNGRAPPVSAVREDREEGLTGERDGLWTARSAPHAHLGGEAAALAAWGGLQVVEKSVQPFTRARPALAVPYSDHKGDGMAPYGSPSLMPSPSDAGSESAAYTVVLPRTRRSPSPALPTTAPVPHSSPYPSPSLSPPPPAARTYSRPAYAFAPTAARAAPHAGPTERYGEAETWDNPFAGVFALARAEALATTSSGVPGKRAASLPPPAPESHKRARGCFAGKRHDARAEERCGGEGRPGREEQRHVRWSDPETEVVGTGAGFVQEVWR